MYDIIINALILQQLVLIAENKSLHEKVAKLESLQSNNVVSTVKRKDPPLETFYSY